MKTLFTNALVIDGLGGYQERSAVLVEDDRIVAMGPKAATPSSAADRVIDLEGRTLMPGLIDCHVHVGGGDYDPANERDSVGLAALRTVEAVQNSLYAGFTTIRNASSRDFVDVDARDAMRAGVFLGPRLVCVGRGLTMTGGHFHFYAVEVDGPDNIRAEVRRQVKRGVDAIKIFASGGVGTAGQDPGMAMFTAEEVAAAADEARRAGKPSFVHAMGIGAIRNSIAAGVTEIHHGNYMDEEACQKMIDRGIWYVPTFSGYYYFATKRLAEPEKCIRAERVLEPLRQAFQMAMRMGAKIGLAADCGAISRMKNGENALEFWLHVQNGMSPEETIVAGTSRNAQLLGLDHLIGSVEPGKRADLVAVEGNPLDDISVLQHNVVLVMRDGILARNQVGDGRTDVDWRGRPTA